MTASNTKMKKLNVIFVLLFIGSIAQITFAQKPKTSPPEEKATFVKGTRLLEQDPFNKKAKDINKGLLFWLIEAPDVSVSLCSDFLDPVGDKYKYLPELTAQYTFGMGAFIIENPDKAKDEAAVFTGGLESVSRRYESMIKVKPETINIYLDSLVEKRTKGELRQLVEDILKKGGCKTK